ncbi:MAG: hypothetical protein C0619_05680, partial [Desulfuromonas sp.]
MRTKLLVNALAGFVLLSVIVFCPATSQSETIEGSEGTIGFEAIADPVALPSFEFYFPQFQIDPIFPGAIFSIDLSQQNYLFTGLTIDNSLLEGFSVVSGFEPTIGLDLIDNESVQPGFLLLDGTLAIDIYTAGETDIRKIDGRRGLLTTYRISAPQGLRSAIRWDGARTEGRIGLRADGLRWNGLRWNGLRWDGLRLSGARTSDLSDARVFRLNESTGEWKRAVRAIRAQARADIRFRGDASPDGVLGHYGYNSTNNY